MKSARGRACTATQPPRRGRRGLNKTATGTRSPWCVAMGAAVTSRAPALGLVLRPVTRGCCRTGRACEVPKPHIKVPFNGGAQPQRLCCVPPLDQRCCLVTHGHATALLTLRTAPPALHASPAYVLGTSETKDQEARSWPRSGMPAVLCPASAQPDPCLWRLVYRFRFVSIRLHWRPPHRLQVLAQAPLGAGMYTPEHGTAHVQRSAQELRAHLARHTVG